MRVILGDKRPDRPAGAGRNGDETKSRTAVQLDANPREVFTSFLIPALHSSSRVNGGFFLYTSLFVLCSFEHLCPGKHVRCMHHTILPGTFRRNETG